MPDIPQIAAKALRQQTIERSKADSPNSLNRGGATKEVFDAINAIGKPYERLALEFRKVQVELPIVAEETNMLWWLFSEHSRDGLKKWSELSVPAVSIMAGKELCDLTRVLPGPAAAMALFSKERSVLLNLRSLRRFCLERPSTSSRSKMAAGVCRPILGRQN